MHTGGHFFVSSRMHRRPPPKLPYKRDCFTVHSQSVFGSQVDRIPRALAMTTTLDYALASSHHPLP